VRRLLIQLYQLCDTHEIQIILTLNAPALDAQLLAACEQAEFAGLQLLQNASPKGFGANHNHAFNLCQSDYFCVMNPDIEIIDDPFPNLTQAFSNALCGLAYPSQIDTEKIPLDFEREIVTPWNLVKRHALYNSTKKAQAHWVNGAFMLFKSDLFKELGGFDERYFMYCEDVDICLRLQLAGYQLKRADSIVMHHTQRRTLKNWRHLNWHVRSLLQLWRSVPYRRFKAGLMT
jgi:N-acetylglucosaminyl-diphospho-decaprenol L-rhamnosyltransferase